MIGASGGIWTASQKLIVTGYTADGQILARWELEGLPTSISAGPDGEVVVVLQRRHVLPFDSDGSLLYTRPGLAVLRDAVGKLE